MEDETALREEIKSILAELAKDAQGLPYQTDKHLIRLAILQGKIACLNDIISARAEKLTRRIVNLTVVLVFLTVGLLAFTIVLYEDSHTQAQGNNLKQNRTTQQP